MAVDPELQQRREQVILEHMRSENEQRFDDTIATFAHPRYELMASRGLYAQLWLLQQRQDTEDAAAAPS